MSIGYDEIMAMIYTLEKNDLSVTDQEVIHKVTSWTPSYSCETAAAGYFMAVSSVLLFRPQLEEPLLKKALEPLYYLGITNTLDVIDWVKSYQIRQGTYSPLKSGLIWLSNFSEKEDSISKILLDLKDEE